MHLDEKIERFLRDPLFGKLGTVGRDGSPHVTPIWYMYEDGRLIINTTTERVKFKNVRRDDRVCLLVDNGYSYVAIFGRARIAKERDSMKDIETLAIRYHGEEKGRKMVRDSLWKMDRVSLEVVPERVVADL